MFSMCCASVAFGVYIMCTVSVFCVYVVCAVNTCVCVVYILKVE